MTMKKIIKLVILIMVLSIGLSVVQSAFAAEGPGFHLKGAAGLGMGGNFTPLVSDISTALAGAGVGNQYSFYFAALRDHPIGIKLRYDIIKARQEALMRTPTDYYSPGTRYRESEQNWQVWSLNAEKIFAGRSQTLFWEMGLGYAFGESGNVTVVQSTGTNGNQMTFPQSMASSWTIMTGFGIRKALFQGWTAVADGRTMLLLHTAYAEGPFSNSFVWPFPIMMSLNLEYQFDIK